MEQLMAWRLGDWICQGELDDTFLGWTTGWLKIEGIERPLQLKLAGNCHPDLAGWKIKIVRTEPIPDWVEPLKHPECIAVDQSGIVGDVTADQTLKQFECSVEEFVRRTRAGNPPATIWQKSLYLEWYSNKNGRVVVQSTRLAVRRQGERAFELTDEQWADQARQNANEISHFMLQLDDAIESQTGTDE